MSNPQLPTEIDSAALAQIFTDARTTYNWSDAPVDDALIQKAWDLARLASTAMNCSPLRFKVIRSDEARAKLVGGTGDGNKAKVQNAPVVLLLAYSTEFYKHMADLFPAMPTVGEMFASNPEMAAAFAKDNAWLQAAYLMIALRAVGLGVGPMNGADFDQISADFYQGTDCVPFLIVNTGYAADPASDWPRSPRLSYRQVAETL